MSTFPLAIADPSVSDILKQIQQNVRKVLDEIDFDLDPETKGAVISHGFRVTVETELTHDKGRVLGAANGVRFLASDLGEDPGEAIDAASQMLENARRPGISPIEIILLYGDGCDASCQREGGWICPQDGGACVARTRKITYEPTNEGRGWFLFHHHHWHISLTTRRNAGLNSSAGAGEACLRADCGEAEWPMGTPYALRRLPGLLERRLGLATPAHAAITSTWTLEQLDLLQDIERLDGADGAAED